LSLAQTPSQTVGPFFSIGLGVRPQNELVEASTSDAVRLSGSVLDGAGAGVADAMVEIWQADRDGGYRDGFGWGRCGTDGSGRFSFVTVKPGAVADPAGWRQAPHLTVLVFARGLLKPVLTRMYFPDEQPANDADPVLSALGDEARATLVAEPDGDALTFDIRLQGDRQTTFFAL
jgi:protocatechuate 3,4-dioxygenase, alpha subunit